MGSFQDCMLEYHCLLQQGTLQVAYKGLMDYLSSLKIHFSSRYPEFHVPGTLYTGYMDMSYFALVPDSMKQKSLKIAVVFLHEEFRFEVWLSGVNRQVQAKVGDSIKGHDWTPYRLVPNPQTADAILEHALVENPDFGDLEALTTRIESGTLKFIQDVELFLTTVSL